MNLDGIIMVARTTVGGTMVARIIADASMVDGTMATVRADEITATVRTSEIKISPMRAALVDGIAVMGNPLVTKIALGVAGTLTAIVNVT
jgi:hypothetical protein